MSCKSNLETLKDHLDQSCEYEPHINVGVAKDHDKNYIIVRPPLVRHLLCDCLLLKNIPYSYTLLDMQGHCRFCL